MSDHPALPLTSETITQLVERWKGLHPCIEKVKLFDGRDFERALVFVAKASTTKADLAELREWSISAFEDGALLEVAAAHRKDGRPFGESEWRFFADEREGLPNEFLGSDSYWELYPEIRFVTPRQVQPANPTDQRGILDTHFRDLSFDVLAARAERWVNTCYPEVPIKRVLLYNYSSKFAGYLLKNRPRNNTAPGLRLPEYAIVFDVDADDETATLTPDEEFAYAKKRVSGEISETPIDRLIQDTQLRATVDASSYPQFLQADFRMAYRIPPDEIPPNSWDFAIKFRNTELQDSIRDEAFEPFVVLWPLLKGVQGVSEHNPTIEIAAIVRREVAPIVAAMERANCEKELAARAAEEQARKPVERNERERAGAETTKKVVTTPIDPEGQKPRKNLLPCPPGTRWQDIRITLIDDETVRIKTPNGEERFSYHELGMSDKRKGNGPTILWAMLRKFAQNQGNVSRKLGANFDKRLTSTTKRLNTRLQDIFGINESIFRAHYRKSMAYETKIVFSDQTIVIR